MRWITAVALGIALVPGCSTRETDVGVGNSSSRIRDLRERFGASAIGEASPGITALAHLPSSARGVVRVEDSTTHVAVQFALRDAANVRAESEGGLTVYRGALSGGDVIHRVHRDGVEDLVAFETRPAREELVYDVDVSRAAGVRLVSNTFELVDATGTPRLRIAPPWVIDADGERHDARLAVEDCAYDTDSSAPWEHPIVAAGASTCTVRVTWRDVIYPALVDPDWQTTGSLAVARQQHTATLLCAPAPCTGNVLIAGGASSASAAPYSSAELYNGTGVFAATGSMSAPRRSHTATRLASGRVLIAGGWTTGAVDLSTAELFTGSSFTLTGAMTARRSKHTATLLGTGKVLIAGGHSCAVGPCSTTPVLSTAELFDGTSTFAATGAMTSQRYDHAEALLASGRVLLVGGRSPITGLSSAELFNGTSFTATTGSMAYARSYGHTATRLPSGKVLVVGNAGSSAELFDGTNTFALTGSMTELRYLHTATLLPSGKVLLAGGTTSLAKNLSTAELFDGTNMLPVPTNMLMGPRCVHTATLLASGKVLLAAGAASGAISTAELYAALPPGATCAASADCASNVCEDGRCCSAACAGNCRTCNTSGACVAVTAADDPNTCTGTSTCDATGSCKLKTGQGSTSGLLCASGFAADGVCCNTACAGGCDACNQAGSIGTCKALPAGSLGTCAPYVCGGGAACPTTCTIDANCVAGKRCSGGSCVNPVTDAGPVDTGVVDTGVADTGVADTGDADSGVADTEAPDTEPSDTGVTEDSAPAIADGASPPTTTTVGLTRCNADYECSTGHCVEGVCCDTACRDKCMSCVLAATPGKCSPQPNGYDLHGDCESATCRTTCGGRGTCEPVIAGTQCARAQCTDRTHGKGPASCPGLGAACPVEEQIPFDCGIYACFAPTGGCLTQCTSSDDCAENARCDLTTNKCVALPPVEEDSGCSTTTTTTHGDDSGVLVLALLVVGLMCRRSRMMEK